MEIYIREATIQDAKSISQVGSQSFRDTFGWQFEGFEDDLNAYVEKTYAESKIEASLRSENNILWLAFVDEKPVGFAKFKIRSSYRKEDISHSELQKIYVSQEYLGSGAGKILYAALEEKWTSLDTDFIWLLVEVNNARAIRFYEKEGYYKKSKADFVIGRLTFKFELMEKKKVSIV